MSRTPSRLAADMSRALSSLHADMSRTPTRLHADMSRTLSHLHADASPSLSLSPMLSPSSQRSFEQQLRALLQSPCALQSRFGNAGGSGQPLGVLLPELGQDPGIRARNPRRQSGIP
eukprot:jgi/Botrbrau1/5361/Bobra.0346s0031.1